MLQDKWIFASAIISLGLFAQIPNATQETNPAPGQITQAPIFRVEVVARTTQAVNYLHRGGSTEIDFQGTVLDPNGKGQAQVQSERGVIRVSADFKNLELPSSYGPEYLTYVLWAISPDGRPVNLGELTLSDWGTGSSSRIDTTSNIQTFGMIVTAEPYYAVTQPSDVVVMENVVRPDTRGVIEWVDAKYELLPRGMYSSQGRASGFEPIRVSKKDPFELYEAENAVQIARVAGADQYASDSYAKAVDALEQAQNYQAQQPGQKPVITMAREACVRAEDSRAIAIRAERKEAEAKILVALVERTNLAKAQAEAAKAQAEAAQTEAEREAAARAQADAARAQAEADRALAERERAAAEEQQQELAAETEMARAAAADAEARRLKAEQDQAELRRQLLMQFKAILQTRDTPRGLIVSMPDVLFAPGMYSLKPAAREKLAKVSGIILGHPGLRIEVEGYTDSIGSDQFNLKLSQKRADAVRDYLIAQGLNGGSVTAQGYGKTNPVADNRTATGRQQNRRVELVISGEILGTPLTGATGGD